MSEACEWLRLDVLCGSPAKAHDALHRLVYHKRLIRPVIYAGPGGGRCIYPRAELEAFVDRMRGIDT